MSHPVMRQFVATVGAMSLLAAFTVATAQSPQPPEVTIYPVSFPSGSIVLHTADYETIHGIAAMMARDPALVAVVLGKADTMGPHIGPTSVYPSGAPRWYPMRWFVSTRCQLTG